MSSEYTILIQARPLEAGISFPSAGEQARLI